MSYLQTNNTIIKNKAELLNLAQELGNISKACKVMGFSRDTFYCYQNAVEEGGVEAYGEIETVNPGYLGFQDTFYVGTLLESIDN